MWLDGENPAWQSTVKIMISPFSIPNVRLFILFKVFFNSRFYYPVFTVLFLDFGLSVAQFSILNAIWAATIVLAEVPSGALADIVGRKRLLNFATATMMVEVGIIAFMPRISPLFIFTVFLVNRILSGLAEAAASGADEAIAYDSLVEKGDPEQWGRVLEVMTRFQSVGFIVAMSVGAAVYDPELVTRVAGFLGLDILFAQETTMRFPLYLTFLLSMGAFLTTLRMQENAEGKSSGTGAENVGVRETFRQTLAAGKWIVNTPFALSVILFGMMFDGIIRMVITLNSQYYRMILIPESVFGLIGSLVAMLGFIVPKIANWIAGKKSYESAVAVTAVLSFTGLFTMNLFLPYIGIIGAVITFSAMYFNGFFVSFYINQCASSEIRATVLSFKGLAYNLSYGMLGILYAMVLRTAQGGGETGNQIFVQTFFWFPAAFVVWLVLLSIIYGLFLKKRI